MQKTVGKIYKTLIYDDEVSLAVLDTTSLVQTAIERHGLSPVAAAALGRTMTATAYLCSWLKRGEDGVSVTVNGGGKGGKICVSGNGEYHLRGFIEHPQVELAPRADGKLDVGGCVGKNGTLTVIREEGEGIPFVGTCELVSGELAEDFASYFFTSEQRPTAIALGVKISPEGKCVGAGGLILQPLPFASEQSLDRTERAISQFSALSALIAEKGAQGILKEYFGVEQAEERELFYRCHCSKEKIEGILHSMGEQDLRQIIEDEGKISVHCHYCNTEYEFTQEDVDGLIAREKRSK